VLAEALLAGPMSSAVPSAAARTVAALRERVPFLPALLDRAAVRLASVVVNIVMRCLPGSRLRVVAE
jgi:hypothetical protein